jgi:tetratricopeptide (TPR) repeat protein
MDWVAFGRSVELVTGMFLGGLLCWLGYKLFEIGVSGKASLIAERGKLKFQLVNASPGLFFALFGSFLIFSGITQTTKYNEIRTPGDQTVQVSLEKGMAERIQTAKDNIARLNQDLYTEGLEAFKADRSDQAVMLFDAIVAGSERYAESCNALAWLYARKNTNLDRALVLARIAVSTDPNRVEYLHTLSEVYRVRGENEKAADTLQKALKLDPADKRLQEALDALK